MARPLSKTFTITGTGALDIIPTDWRRSEISVRTVVTGTVDYTLEQTFDEFNYLLGTGEYTSVSDIDFSDSTSSNMVNATGSEISNFDKPVTGVRLNINSFTGSPTIELKIVQADY